MLSPSRQQTLRQSHPHILERVTYWLTSKVRHPVPVTQNNPRSQGQNCGVHRGCLHRLVRLRAHNVKVIDQLENSASSSQTPEKWNLSLPCCCTDPWLPELDVCLPYAAKPQHLGSNCDAMHSHSGDTHRRLNMSQDPQCKAKGLQGRFWRYAQA
jgi:hypothetical protein